jgi:hypothetical protein
MGDVADLRQLAQRMQQLSMDTRGAAAAMRNAQDVSFVSPAAERYRADLRHEASNADHAAKELEDAFRALAHHADEVEDRLREIARIEHFFGGLLSDAEHEAGRVARDAGNVAGGAVHAVSEGASRVLDLARHAPPSGHPGWLDFKHLLP